MTLGQKLSMLRTAMNLSQEQLAEKIEVSRQSVSKWESDQTLPEVGKILLLSNIFNVSVDNLLRDEITLDPLSLEYTFTPNDDIVFNGKYFGTDGFRGEANLNLTAEHAFKIGRFLGWYYSKKSHNHKTRVVIGKDTRRSSYMLEYAIVAGLTSSGADAYMLHVTTTPSVSYVVRQDRFDCGVMISASHNPYYDNGIKLINSAGEKMDNHTLALIEDYIDGNFENIGISGEDLPHATRDKIGRTVDYVAGRNRYVGYLISIAANSYRRFNVALDCANGASWMIAKSVFDALGAQTHIINASPDGININENAGSTHIEKLCKYVKDNHLDAGFAFDGDADRCIAVDENGNVVNGDHILYIIANRLRSKDALPSNTVVTTIMSNMGLYRAFDAAGINHIQTTVGDRFVHEAMMQNDYYLGGEQSGHTIIRKYANTGDGILTAIILMEELVDSKLPLSKLAEPVKMFPQCVKNITVDDKKAVTENSQIKDMIDEISAELGDNGRILLRESGTEPVIRIMVEADTLNMCESKTQQVADLIKKLGLSKKN